MAPKSYQITQLLEKARTIHTCTLDAFRATNPFSFYVDRCCLRIKTSGTTNISDSAYEANHLSDQVHGFERPDD